MDIGKRQSNTHSGLNNPRTPDSGFTLKDLLATLAALCLLAAIALPAMGNAKNNSRQLSCMNNLRQLGTAMQMYGVDFGQYPGCCSIVNHCYAWAPRLLSYTQGQKKLFSCPAANPRTWWDTNFNVTLGGKNEIGRYDPYSILADYAGKFSRFSYGINDWGVSIQSGIFGNNPLGMGGDVDDPRTGMQSGKYLVKPSNIVAPDRMIVIADTQGETNLWAANIDPATTEQWPSNRHQYQTDIVFVDGHVETPLRSDVINPTNLVWRPRWNNDNQPHNEYGGWSVANEQILDPSY